MVAAGVEVAGDHQRSLGRTDLWSHGPPLGHAGAGLPLGSTAAERGHRVEPWLGANHHGGTDEGSAQDILDLWLHEGNRHQRAIPDAPLRVSVTEYGNRSRTPDRARPPPRGAGRRWWRPPPPPPGAADPATARWRAPQGLEARARASTRPASRSRDDASLACRTWAPALTVSGDDHPAERLRQSISSVDGPSYRLATNRSSSGYNAAPPPRRAGSRRPWPARASSSRAGATCWPSPPGSSSTRTSDAVPAERILRFPVSLSRRDRSAGADLRSGDERKAARLTASWCDVQLVRLWN
jgi:hypothetical protein